MREPALEFHNISKSFTIRKKKKIVVRDLSLTIYEGEVFGFLGPNGAGKSTTIKLLLNFLRCDTGTVQIDGQSSTKREAKHHVGYLPEAPFFYEHLTARETLTLSGQLSGMPSTLIKERIPRLLGRMGLTDATDSLIAGYSKGMKQRLGLANALIHDPKILILDEPMSGLDPIGRHQVKQLILDLKKEGKTVFFSSHILSDIEILCDSIGIIHKGILLYSGALKDFLVSTNSLEETFLHLIEHNDHANAY